MLDLDGLADSRARTDRRHTLGLAIFIVAVVSLAFQCGEIPEAQANDGAALALARTCAGETSWGHLDECTAIGEVLARRSRTGRVTPAIARAYSSALRPHSRHVRPWLFELDASGQRPDSWPEGPSWAVWGPRWLDLLAHARRTVEGEAVAHCSRPPDHWGAPSGVDYARAVRAGWVPVDCGRTRNRFWRVPGR